MSTVPEHHEEEAVERAYDWRLMRRLLVYLKSYRWLAVAALMLLTVNSALEISMTVLIQIGIDDYIATDDIGGLQSIALTFIGVVLLVLVTAFGQLYLAMWLGQKVQHDIRIEIFSHLQKLHPAFFDKNPLGRLVTRVTNDVSTLNELFSSGVVTIIGDLLSLIFIIAALLYYNWQLALLTFLVLPLLAVAIFWFRSRIRRCYRDIRVRLARLNSFSQEHISGVEQIQLFGGEKDTCDKFDIINTSLKSAHLRSIYYSALFLPAMEIIGALSIAVLLQAGGIRVLEGVLTFGELVAFIHLVERFYGPIHSLAEQYNVLQASMASSERIFALLDTQPAYAEPVGAVSTAKGSQGISFENVSFAYDNENWVLEDVSLAIAPGEKVAIVGATGAGKTSLVSLLYRFYDYQTGCIKLDGVPVTDIPIDELRSRLGLVLQEVFLFGGSIADNVRLGNSDVTDAEVVSALEHVGFQPFLDNLPDGIHTQVGERGASLSTGQKQLLSFARAMAFDPDILILDEATSSVDPETEQIIQNALNRLMSDRTSIIIAHRLSTIKEADRIIVLHHGRVREIGTHSELLTMKGIYNKLYHIQFGDQNAVARDAG